MSVKSKIKRLNREKRELERKIEMLEMRARATDNYGEYDRPDERTNRFKDNLIKLMVTNNAMKLEDNNCALQVSRRRIETMNNAQLIVEYIPYFDSVQYRVKL